jgi:vacuolar-type H+-ATPase subunit H
LKETIERILEAEEDAKGMERDAREQAKRIVEEARKEAGAIVSRARDAAREEGQRELEGARAAAQGDRAKILDDAEAGARAMLENAGIRDYEVIKQAARRIGGLEE